MSQDQPEPLPFFEPEVVLYHADCPDGFGAAWAIWTRCPEARFVTARHGQPPPDNLVGKRVVILDFSYARSIIERLASEVPALAVIDHHITAQEALGDLPYTHYEQNKSGAVLAWEWAHRAPAPWLLEYVQDGDLGRWVLPNSRAINAAIESYPFDFARWNGFIREALAQEGAAILRSQAQQLEKILASAVLVRFHGEIVLAIQSLILRSELGEQLCGPYPFCLVWYEREGRRYVSLRSRDGGADVSVIAQAYGGGGHRRAASFSVPIVKGHPMPFTTVVSRIE